MPGKRLRLKTTLSGGRIFGKLANNRIVVHVEKCGLFSDSQWDFKSSRSTTDFLTVACDRIERPFNRSRATRVVAINISMASDRV